MHQTSSVRPCNTGHYSLGLKLRAYLLGLSTFAASTSARLVLRNSLIGDPSLPRSFHPPFSISMMRERTKAAASSKWPTTYYLGLLCDGAIRHLEDQSVGLAPSSLEEISVSSNIVPLRLNLEPGSVSWVSW